MVKSARREYLETIRRRYRKARKKDKKPILDELYANRRAAADIADPAAPSPSNL